jgi:hypothetical protein
VATSIKSPARCVPAIKGRAAELLDKFIRRTLNRFTGKHDRAIHPLHYRHFYRFIHYAHSVRSRLAPEHLAAHLKAGGFPPGQIAKLVQTYEIGRRVLAVNWLPWETGKRKKAPPE